MVVLAGVALCVIMIGIVPAQFREITKLKGIRTKTQNDINEHKRHARNKEEIQSRLSTLESQALAAAGTPLGSEAVAGYRGWLMALADGAGLRNYTATPPSTSGGNKGITYSKHTFTITGEGRLSQIAEFLRRFHRTEYLHTIQQVHPSPIANRQGEFKVTFRIEALSLPQIRLVNMPSNDGLSPSEDERQKITMIRNRAIFSEYVPPYPLTVADRTAESVTLTWPPNVDAVSHDIRYKKRADANVAENWNIVGFATPTGTIDGLVAGTEYEFQIRTVSNLGPDAWTPTPSVNAATRAPVASSESEFDDVQYCFLNGITEADGKPQCWIYHRTQGRSYFLFEGGSFRLGDFRCIIRKIDIASEQILFETVGVGWFSLSVGKHFDAVDAVTAPTEME